MPKILQKDSQVLRKHALEVNRKDMQSARIKKIVADMKNALYAEDDGIAIAAPQIGVSMRIFIVSGKFFYLEKNKDELRDIEFEAADEKEFRKKDIVFFNPIIIKSSRKKIWETEGCLSVRWKYGETHRSAQVTIRAYNENGILIERGASGLLAQIFQHEIDHLNGILFTDNAKNIKEIKDK